MQPLFQIARSGALVALENRCPHRQAPLSMGRVIGDEIVCRYHGWAMAADGRCVHLMTPETETSNHYFFAFTRDFAPDGGYPNDADMRRERETTCRARPTSS